MFYKFTTNHLDIALIGHTEQKVNSLQDNIYLMYLQSKCIQYTLRSKDKCTILYSQEKYIYSPFILEGEKEKESHNHSQCLLSSFTCMFSV